MIFASDLHIGSILSLYMKHAGYTSTLFSDCLSLAHVLRRTTDMTLRNVIETASTFLDYVFMLGLRRGSVLEPSDLRLYTRVYVASRLPPVAQLWNNLSDLYMYTSQEPEYLEAYDIIESENCAFNHVYLRFDKENYYATPSQLLKFITHRRSLDVQTFSNAKVTKVDRVVFFEDQEQGFTEENTQPLKIYHVNEVDKPAFELLSGKFKLDLRG
jgi:hypothetical protein